MKTKRISFVLAILTLCLTAFPVFADDVKSTALSDGSQVISYADGSYTVISPVIDELETQGTRASGSTTKSKYARHYESNGSLTWEFRLTASFNYTGSSATCMAAVYGNTINVSGWSLSGASATKSGNKATGTGTYLYKVLGVTLQSVPVNLTLTCDANGNVS